MAMWSRGRKRRRLYSGRASGGGLLLRRLFPGPPGCDTILSLLILGLDAWPGLKRRRGGGFVKGGGGGVMMVMVRGGGSRVVVLSVTLWRGGGIAMVLIAIEALSEIIEIELLQWWIQ